MKLFTRYNRINLLSTVIIFLLASGAFYFLLKYVLISQVDEDLKIEQHEIEIYSGKYTKLPEALPVKDQKISFVPINSAKSKRTFSTVKGAEKGEREEEAFRQVVFSIKVNDQWYEITVAKSLEGTDDMMRSIIVIRVLTILLILITSFIINRILLTRLWQPFYHTLGITQAFKLGQKQLATFPATKIDEFAVMNNTLEQFINKAENDYQLLKEFTENASHELQTPLAVIRSKLDLLVQDENLSEEQSKAVQAANDSLQKLSRLNQSLLLLSKIENRQFSETSQIQFKSLVEEKLDQFRELWLDKGITTSVSLENVNITMNLELAEILLNNLFSNATRHTGNNSTIRVSLTNLQFVISNPAMFGTLDNNRLFNRFYKAGKSSDNNGLGLSIVQKIATVSGYFVQYRFINNQHEFSFLFS